MSRKHTRTKKLLMGIGHDREAAEFFIRLGRSAGLSHEQMQAAAKEVLSERRASTTGG